jgi:hypothetical protein
MRDARAPAAPPPSQVTEANGAPIPVILLANKSDLLEGGTASFRAVQISYLHLCLAIYRSLYVSVHTRAHPRAHMYM